MLYGLDALAHGAIVAMIAVLPATLLFWRLTPGLSAGARALRPFVACSAAFGLVAVAGALFALNFERGHYEDEAMAGALLVGGALQLLAFAVLLLLPRRS